MPILDLLVHQLVSVAYLLPPSSELRRFGEADADIVLYGHTHRQVVRRIGRVLVVNPGSAGAACRSTAGAQVGYQGSSDVSCCIGCKTWMQMLDDSRAPKTSFDRFAPMTRVQHKGDRL